ncbi:HAMP domain-containing histidine kinase [bacterium SCSIO 12741]|nr:HAMP domain-containing histidine kinase [bacterium SCSIO 12741]
MNLDPSIGLMSHQNGEENGRLSEVYPVAQESFDRLTLLNNEMANMQRQLAKKNIKLEELNQALADKNAQLDQFAHVVSHDLKSPLTSIVGLLELIENGNRDELSDGVMELFELVKQQSQRMGDLISGILDYSRADRVNEDITEFNLRDLIDEIMLSLSKPRSFQVILPDYYPDLKCSYIQLGQILTNLLSNAIKYHDKSFGKIELIVQPVDSQVLKMAVSDDGPGIPEMYHEKLFTLFETANQSNRTDSTGVGLAIVKKLVEKAGGEVGLNSKVGHGSEFWFTWPIKHG